MQPVIKFDSSKLVEITVFRLERIFQPLRALKFMTVHMVYSLAYTEILQTTATNSWGHTVFLGKEVNEYATVPRDDMIFTLGQLNAARDGILIFNKWDNEKGEGSAKAVLPYQFDNKLNKDEQLIVKSVIQRFNNDMKSCLEIK